MAMIRQNPDNTLGFVSEGELIEVERLGGPTTASVANAQYRGNFIAKIPLTASDSAGGVFAYQPPDTGRTYIFWGVILDVTTQSAGACTVSIGVAANNTTLNAGLLSGQSVAATGTTIGTLVQKYTAATQFVTGSVASGASSGLVGFAYLRFIVVS